LMHSAAAERKAENRVQEVSQISRGLKALGRELQVPVIALSQLSRSVEARVPRRPQLSDLRESGAIEQDADVVMFLYRPAYYGEEEIRKAGYDPEKDSHITELSIAKQRNGPTGSVKLVWKADMGLFGNLTDKY
jgi:replicative DNA helicase